MQYDVAVIGNDEAAFEMLCAAAQAGKRTAAILPESSQSAWFTGLALKNLVSDLLVDQSPERRNMLQNSGSPRLLQTLLIKALASQTLELSDMLTGIGVDVHHGQTRFVNHRHVSVTDGRHCRRSTLSAHNFVIATGIRYTSRHQGLGLVTSHRAESLFEGTVLPEHVCLLGGDSVGAGLAALFSLFGVQASHLAHDEQDDAMIELAQAAGVEVGFHPAELGMDSQQGLLPLNQPGIIDCRRAVGFSDALHLSALGIEPDENGQLWCSADLETWCSGVFGIGDIVGFSSSDTLSPVAQADRILRRINLEIPRPHLLDLFVNADRGSKQSRRKIAQHN